MLSASSAANDPGGVGLAPDTSDRFARALAAAVRQDSETMRELRSALCPCVHELKACGMECEQLLAVMKDHVRRTAISHPPRGRDRSRASADHLLDDLVHWCILEYYRTE
jgi:hypothetical protein